MTDAKTKTETTLRAILTKLCPILILVSACADVIGVATRPNHFSVIALGVLLALLIVSIVEAIHG